MRQSHETFEWKPPISDRIVSKQAFAKLIAEVGPFA